MTLFNSHLITLKSFQIGLEPAAQFPYQWQRLDGLCLKKPDHCECDILA